MTDKEIVDYLNGNPTIEGIVSEMKTWWSNDGTDKILQMCFDKILELAEMKCEPYTRKERELYNSVNKKKMTKIGVNISDVFKGERKEE